MAATRVTLSSSSPSAFPPKKFQQSKNSEKVIVTYMGEPLTLDMSVIILVEGSKPKGNSALNKLHQSVPHHQTNYQFLADKLEGIL
jgi:hypothetical protein